MNRQRRVRAQGGGMTPQEIVDKFWKRFHTRRPGKVTSIFPRSMYATLLPGYQGTGRDGATSARNAAESYEQAAQRCRDLVARVVRECDRTNEKFTDADFDIEEDLIYGGGDCLNGLLAPSPGESAAAASSGAGRGPPPPAIAHAMDVLGAPLGNHAPPLFPRLGHEGGMCDVSTAALKSLLCPSAGGSGADGDNDDGQVGRPETVHRVDWIFEKPAFIVDGFSSSDIEQGGIGDCWFMAAVASMAHRRDLMERVCVARHEECGVYGFVFYRDGEWIPCLVDDNLYLQKADFEAGDRDIYDPTGRREREHRGRHQTGSRALYFARCHDPNETWLPLLEKAYAKAHGDFAAISGGWVGDGVEDLTGGVHTVLKLNRIMRKDRLWDEIRQSQKHNSEFLFALAKFGKSDSEARNGLTTGHAYTIINAREEFEEHDQETRKNPVRLVQIRNPWGPASIEGIGEWRGPWSDGSDKWSSYWLNKLSYKFGDDGIFWMSYEGMLDHFDLLHRTRIFDDKWTVVQQWTSTNVAWVTGFLQSKFVIDIKVPGQVVIVLCQLNKRYFKGLQGQYDFDLHFILQKEGSAPGDFLCRVRGEENLRSVSCEIKLDEPGRYEVIPKVTATRDEDVSPVETVVREKAATKPQKLRQIGMQYDLAHAKVGIVDEDEELERRRAEAKKKAKAKRGRRRQDRFDMRDAADHVHVADMILHRVVDPHRGEHGRENKTGEDGDHKDDKDKDKKDKDKKDKKDAKADASEEAKGEETDTEKTGITRESGTVGSVAADKNAPAPARQEPTPTPEPEPHPSPGVGSPKTVEAPRGEGAITRKADPPSRAASPPVPKPADETPAAGEAAGTDQPDAGGEVPPPPPPAGDGEVGDGAAAPSQLDGEVGRQTVDDRDGDEYMNDDADEDSDVSEDEDSASDGGSDVGSAGPWNAVCVLGLRVYAQDPDVTITLAKPENMTEAASLTVTEEAPAGATM